MQKILNLGATGDKIDDDTRTACSYAAEKGDSEVRQILLDHDALLGRERNLAKEADFHERTLFSWVAQGGMLEVAQYLIKHEADLDVKCRESALL